MTPTSPSSDIDQPLAAVPKYPAVARISPVSVTSVPVSKPLPSMIVLPAMFIVPPVIVAPVVMFPLKTASPVEALIEKVAVSTPATVLKPARPVEFKTTLGPDDADAPE